MNALETKILFEDYFYECEGFALRAERFFDDCQESDMVIMKSWLEAAFAAGYAAKEGRIVKKNQ